MTTRPYYALDLAVERVAMFLVASLVKALYVLRWKR